MLETLNMNGAVVRDGLPQLIGVDGICEGESEQQGDA
jgi:hypothetical protein